MPAKPSNLYTPYQVQISQALDNEQAGELSDLLISLKEKWGNEGIGREIYFCQQFYNKEYVKTAEMLKIEPYNNIGIDMRKTPAITDTGLRMLAELTSGDPGVLKLCGQEKRINWESIQLRRHPVLERHYMNVGEMKSHQSEPIGRKTRIEQLKLKKLFADHGDKLNPSPSAQR